MLNGNGGLMVRPNHNVHVSINRRIEMPPAFHFPEDQIPPSDLVGLNNHDSPDNAGGQAGSGSYSGLYQDFENLTTEEKYQIFGAAAAAAANQDQNQGQIPVSGHERTEEQELEDIDETLNVVPDVIESDIRHPMPPGIIKKKNSSVSSGSGDEIPESRSRRIRYWIHLM